MYNAARTLFSTIFGYIFGTDPNSLKLAETVTTDRNHPYRSCQPITYDKRKKKQVNSLKVLTEVLISYLIALLIVIDQ